MIIHSAKFFARKKSGQNVLITFERILAQGKRFGLFFLVGGRVTHFSPHPQKWKVHGSSTHKRRIDLAGKNATRLATEPSRPELHVARWEGVHLPGNDQHRGVRRKPQADVTINKDVRIDPCGSARTGGQNVFKQFGLHVPSAHSGTPLHMEALRRKGGPDIG